MKEEKVYMLKNEALKVEIIWFHHNILVEKYSRRWKITELVIRNYWWPGITRDMKRYINMYDMCQRMKNRIEAPARKLKLSKILEKPWIYMTVDFIL